MDKIQSSHYRLTVLDCINYIPNNHDQPLRYMIWWPYDTPQNRKAFDETVDKEILNGQVNVLTSFHEILVHERVFTQHDVCKYVEAFQLFSECSADCFCYPDDKTKQMIVLNGSIREELLVEALHLESNWPNNHWYEWLTTATNSKDIADINWVFLCDGQSVIFR